MKIGKSSYKEQHIGDLVCEVDRLDGPKWDRLINNFADAYYEQTWSYMCARWHPSKISHLIIKNKSSDVLAAAQVIIITLPLINKGMAYLKFGPLWRQKRRRTEPAVLHTVLEEIKNEYVKKRGLYLVVIPPPDPDKAELWQETFDVLGFRSRGEYNDKYRYLVDLSLDINEQRQNLHSKWRYNLKKAETNKFNLKCYEGAQGLPTFLALYSTMINRKGFYDTFGIDALSIFIKTLPIEICPKIFIIEHDELPTAAAIVGKIGNTAIYLFGASDDRALPLKAGYVLQWKIIESLTDTDALWYDLGGEVGAQGLRQFKKGLTGKNSNIIPILGEFSYWKNWISWVIANAAFKLKELKTALGAIFKRWH